MYPDILTWEKSCLVKLTRSQDCAVNKRPLTNRVEGWDKSKVGMIKATINRGTPSSVGLANWSNRFKFMIRVSD